MERHPFTKQIHSVSSEGYPKFNAMTKIKFIFLDKISSSKAQKIEIFNLNR